MTRRDVEEKVSRSGGQKKRGRRREGEDSKASVSKCTRFEMKKNCKIKVNMLLWFIIVLIQQY